MLNVDVCSSQQVRLPLLRPRAKKKMKRCLYQSRRSLHCLTSQRHVKSWLLAVDPAIQRQLQVMSYYNLLTGLLIKDNCLILHILIFHWPLLLATGDLYTWGWGNYLLLLNHSTEFRSTFDHYCSIDCIVLSPWMLPFNMLIVFISGEYGQLGHKTLISIDEPQRVDFFQEQHLHVVDVVCGPWNTFTAVAKEEVT